MAKPRVFVSSTFYDLRQVRTDLKKFIIELGYEPVMNEFGQIPYGKDEKLEEYCYKEISGVDMVISIIGGRYGSQSQKTNNSISQVEVKTALELSKQVYIFIEKDVKSEFQTYLVNKESKETKYRFVQDPRIYEFIEYIENLPNNNNIQSFESAQDIINYLRDQWAGLFQRFLQEQTRIKEINLIKGIESTSKTLNQLVNFLTEERKDNDTAIQDILLSNHPALEQIRHLLQIDYRVYFTTYDEMKEWLRGHGYSEVNQNDMFGESKDHEFVSRTNNKLSLLYINRRVFSSEGKLNVFTKADWDEGLISVDTIESELSPDDGLPF